MTYTIIARSVIIYIVVLILLRIMGKRQIGEMQPFELVITLIIADLATIPMAETALPLLHGIIPLLTLTVIHFLLSVLARKSIWARRLLNGKSIILINPDGIDYQELKKLNLNFDDLMELVRGAGYFNLEEILYAILQTNGTLTVLPRSPYQPLTPNDLNLSTDKNSLPVILISEGKIVDANLKITQLDKNFIQSECKAAGFGGIGEILFLTINNSGKLYIQPRKGAFVSRQTSYEGSEKW